MELGWGLSKILVLPLYITVILVVILTVFKRIEYGIFFLLPFIPHQNILNYLNDLPFGKDVNDILMIAIIIRWIIDKRKSGESFLIKTPLNWAVILFILWTYIEVWWGASYFNHPAPLSLADPRVIFWKNLIRIPLLFLIIVNNIKNPKHLKIIMLLMIIAVVMLDRSFYNIAQYADFSHYYSDTQKVGGMESLGGNELAVCLAMYVIVFVALFSHIRNLWAKVLLFGPIWLTYYCIAFLFSRSGYLAAVAGWAVIGFLKDKKVFIFLIAMILFWQVLLPTAVRERIEMTKTEDGYDGTTRQRLGMWKMGQDIIRSSPILGAGIDASHYVDVSAEGFRATWHSFHNSYVQQAVETGLVGLGIYVWIFILMIRVGWRLFRIGEENFQKAIGLGLIACVFSCMAGNIAGSYWNYFSVVGYMYVLAALVVRSTITIQQESETHLQNIDETNPPTENEWKIAEPEFEYAEYFKEKYS